MRCGPLDYWGDDPETIAQLALGLPASHPLRTLRVRQDALSPETVEKLRSRLQLREA